MSQMITLKIDVTKIDKTAIYEGKKGKYLTMVLFPNKSGQPNDYGDDGMVTQDLGKDRRMAGEKGEILGNFRYIGGVMQKPAQTTAQVDDAAEDDIPF